jgi:hypothetical protein
MNMDKSKKSEPALIKKILPEVMRRIRRRMKEAKRKNYGL